MPGCTDCATDTTDRASSDPLFRRVLWIALIANLAMFFVEIVASHVGDSMSLQADALDFFSDSVNYGISLFVVGMAITARAKASLFKGATMALFGTWVIGSALYRAMTGSAPDPSMMGTIAFAALAYLERGCSGRIEFTLGGLGAQLRPCQSDDVQCCADIQRGDDARNQ